METILENMTMDTALILILTVWVFFLIGYKRGHARGRAYAERMQGESFEREWQAELARIDREHEDFEREYKEKYAHSQSSGGDWPTFIGKRGA